MFPLTVRRSTSPYNREISVLLENGKYTLYVNGSPQSGPYIQRLWQKALHGFHIAPSLPTNSILVLGVAGGTVVRLLQQLFPKAVTVGVDIDQVMVEIGKQYFGLSETTRLKVFLQDALAFVRSAGNKRKSYDLIISDLFSGREIPRFVSSDEFLIKLKHLLTPHGSIIINFLREHEYRRRSERLSAKLEKIFPFVESRELYNNRFFWVR